MVKKLDIHRDERGILMEFLRNDEPLFKKFGQAYMTLVKKGVAKAWHLHKHQDDHFICVEGRAVVGLCDMRPKSPTYKKVVKIFLSSPELSGNHALVKIPKGVAHGFCSYGCDQAKIVNLPTNTYNYKNPDECRFSWNDPMIKFKWPEYVKKGG